MLSRNCEALSLFKKGDFNVRVTLFDKNPKNYYSKEFKMAWIETIRDSLGGGIVNSNNQESFTVTKVSKTSSYLFRGTGSEFINILKNAVDEPKSIRIDIAGEPVRSWIILVPEPEVKKVSI